jgi:hypothetical protein
MTETDLVDRYVSVWNESDPEQRHRLVKELWTDDALHILQPPQVINGEVVVANDALDVLTQGARNDLLTPPINLFRLALHPEGMAQTRDQPAGKGRHVTEGLRAQAARSPDPRLDTFADELATCSSPARRLHTQGWPERSTSARPMATCDSSRR